MSRQNHRMKTAQEVVHTGRLALVDAPHEIVPARKFISAEKNGDNKKRMSGDRQWSLDAHQKKAKSPDQRVLRPPSEQV